MNLQTEGLARRDTPVWQPILFAALAGGMAWGIRGQYGHETGAMIAGLLVSLVLTFLLCPRVSTLAAARAIALGTVGMGIGGSMTYGQTLGLTQNPDMIGNWEALRWGLFGCAVKGAVWIGFAGLFLGIGLGGVRYRAGDMFYLMLALIGAAYLGSRVLNSPFDPASRELPWIYFSADWYWQPGADLEPRRESWGGLWFALIAGIAYAGWLKKDCVARNLALWGIVGGALGFPGGQCLQAYHAWNPEVFKQGFWIDLDPHMNWWNMMETTFGAIMGATLGLGLWLNRERIRPLENDGEERSPVGLEWILLAIHLPLLVVEEFGEVSAVSALYGMGLVMILIPVVGIIGGRWWPYLQMLPLILIPIAGKTVKELSYENEVIGVGLGWLLYVILPLGLATGFAVWVALRGSDRKDGLEFARRALLFNAWLYFCLNFAFFRFPWPWADWTGRTPNGIIFTICVLGLTALALSKRVPSE